MRPAMIRRYSGIFLLFAICLGGCAYPDQWSIFEYARPLPDIPEMPVKSVTPQELPSWTIEKDPPTVAAQGPLQLSVEQAVILALRNNQSLRVRQFDPVIVSTFEQIERGIFDPEIFAEGVYFEERSSETARSTGSQFDVDGTETAGIAGLRQRLPTGTALEASVEQERSISNRAPEQQVARFGLSVTQALLQGFGPAVNLADVRQAELDLRISLFELRGFIEALLAETEIAYWNYVLAEQEIAIFEESLAIARQQRDEIALRIEVGILPEIEIAAAKSEVARREQALIEARSQLEEWRLRLLRLLSPGPFTPFERQVIATSGTAITPRPLTDLETRLELADKMRPDLEEARLRIEQNRLEVIQTRNGLLPRLDFFIALGQTGYADAFSDSFREVNGDTYDFTAGVRLNHFLGSRAAEARNLAAKASRKQAAKALANLNQQVHLDVRLAANEVERARQQIRASQQTRSMEEQTLQAEKERFDVGSSTALLVAQAQRDLLASRIAEVRSVVDYRIALVQLYLAEGSYLERRGISTREKPDIWRD